MKLDLLKLIILCWYAALSRHFSGGCEKWMPPEHVQVGQEGRQGTEEDQQIASSSQGGEQTSQEGLSKDCNTASSHGVQDTRPGTRVAPTELPSGQDGIRLRQLREQGVQENDLEFTLKSDTGGDKLEDLEKLHGSNMAGGERREAEKLESIGTEPEESSGQEPISRTVPQAAEKTLPTLSSAVSATGFQGAGDASLSVDIGGDTSKSVNNDRSNTEDSGWTGQEEKHHGSSRDLSGLHVLSTAPLTAVLYSSSGDKTVLNTEHQPNAQSVASPEAFDKGGEQWEKTSMSGSVGSSGNVAQVDKNTIPTEAASRENTMVSSVTATTVSFGDGESDSHRQAADEDFLSFEEWRKKVLAQQEKEQTSSSDEDSLMTTSPSTSQKLRINFAAKSCGAKVVASNPEMENANYMLSGNRDEYMLNPCSARKWFVVELCEPVVAKAVELASLELFSSQPRSFRVSVGDRYPTKDWLVAGTFEMTGERVPQLFPLSFQSPYVKFVRIEMMDHYGTEHFCPVTLFRVFGLPIDEDIEEPAAQTETEEEEIADGNGEAKNLFSRTKETVVNLVKKVLYKEDKLRHGQPERDGTAPDFVEAGERHGNISEDIMLPCNPDDEKERAGHHVVVNAHQLQSHAETQQIESAGLSTSSVSGGDVPMVTKLGDEDQIENKRGSVGVRDSDQGLVTLIQSGSGIVWDAAHQHCHFHLSSDAACCPHSSLCRYIQIMLGETPPFSHLRSPSVKLSSSLLPAHLSPPLTSASSSSQSVTTGLMETPAMFNSQSFSTVQGIEDSSIHAVSPSSVEVSAVESASGADETMSVGQRGPEDSLKKIKQSEPRHQALESHSDEDKHQSELVGSERLGSSLVATKPVAFESWQEGREEHSTSMQPVSDGHAHGVTVGESEQQQDISSSPDDSSSVVTQAHPMHTARSREQRVDILEPSIQLETTAVVSSDELMRPTPVLEISMASVEGDKREGEVRETALPGVKPTPMSSLVDAAADEGASLYPQTLAPSVEGASAGGGTQTEEEDSGGRAGIITSAPHNTTEKKVNDLDLIHIPLSISAKRETAIMRLTNRIKALELNVSLSSRFLDELSTRFKKQNDDLMKMLNKTISRLNTTAATSQQQNQAQEEKITLLETRLDNLTMMVQHLSDRFESFTEQTAHRQMLSLTFDFVLLVILVMMLLRSTKPAPLHPDIRFLLDTMPCQPLPPSSNKQRRNSDHGVTNHVSKEKVGVLKKGGSEDSLVSMYKKHLPDSTIVADDLQDNALPRKKKRKKNKASKTLSVDMPEGPSHSSQGQALTTAAGVLFGLEAVGLGTSGVHRDQADARGSLSSGRRWGSDSGSIAVIQTEERKHVADSDVTCSDPMLLRMAGSSKPGIIPHSSSQMPTPLPLPPPPPAPAFTAPTCGFEWGVTEVHQVTCLTDRSEKNRGCIWPLKVELLKYTSACGTEDAGATGKSNPGKAGESNPGKAGESNPENSWLCESDKDKSLCPCSTQSLKKDENLSCPHRRQHLRINENKLSFSSATQTCLSKGPSLPTVSISKSSLSNPRLKKEIPTASAMNGIRSSETRKTPLHWYGSLQSRGGPVDARGRGRQEPVRSRGVSCVSGQLKKGAETK